MARDTLLDPEGTQKSLADLGGSGDPWTADEEAAVRRWADEYIATHRVDPAWGGADDIIARYRAERASGVSHDQAFSNLPTWPASFGWEAPGAAGGGATVTKTIAAPTTTGPTNTGGGGGGGGDYYGSGAPGGGLFNPGLYSPFTGEAPSYHEPTLPGAPSFDSFYDGGPTPTYVSPKYRQVDPFRAPTLEEAYNEPGYKFGVEQGERALQQSRASQGLLRTGGTLKDILDYGRNAATQNYGNVFNRSLSSYKENYGTQYADPNAFDLTNAQADFAAKLAGRTSALTDAQARFSPVFLDYQNNFANAQRQSELKYNADWQKYLDSENVFYSNQSNPFSKYLSLAQIGAASA